MEEPEPPPRPVRPLKYRQHFTLHDADNVLLYEYTVIHDLSEKRFETIVLLRDPGHGDVLLHDVAAFSERRSFYRISDVTNRAFIEVSMNNSPYTGRTFSEITKETRIHPEMLSVPTLMGFETNGGEWKDFDAKLTKPDELRRFRHAVRATMDPYLLEAIERMRGTFFRTSEGSGYFMLLGTFVVYDGQTDPPLNGEEKMQDPACDFDDSFGYPCTSEQLQRIRAARAKGKQPFYY